MRILCAFVIAAMAVMPVSADSGQSRSCNHMCPVAQQATKLGFETVSALPMALHIGELRI